MKKLLFILAVVVMMASISGAVLAKEEPEIIVYVDDAKIEFDVAPQTIDYRTMVPFRAIFEALGAKVEWNEESPDDFSAITETKVIKATINKKTLIVNGQEQTIDVAPVIINNRTLVPVRFIAEALGCKVDWIEGKDTSAVIITGSKALQIYENTSILTYGSVTKSKLLGVETSENGNTIYQYKYINPEVHNDYFSTLEDFACHLNGIKTVNGIKYKTYTFGNILTNSESSVTVWVKDDVVYVTYEPSKSVESKKVIYYDENSQVVDLGAMTDKAPTKVVGPRKIQAKFDDRSYYPKDGMEYKYRLEYKYIEAYERLLIDYGFEEISRTSEYTAYWKAPVYIKVIYTSDPYAELIPVTIAFASINDYIEPPECYDGTDLPTYTYVTGIPSIRTSSMEEGVISATLYFYPYSYDDVAKYENYIKSQGWICDDVETDEDSVDAKYVKNRNVVLFSVAPDDKIVVIGVMNIDMGTFNY